MSAFTRRPLAAKRCGGNEAWHLPLGIGPVAVAYNLEGVDDLALSTPVIAKIFKGDITRWCGFCLTSRPKAQAHWRPRRGGAIPNAASCPPQQPSGQHTPWWEPSSRPASHP